MIVLWQSCRPTAVKDDLARLLSAANDGHDCWKLMFTICFGGGGLCHELMYLGWTDDMHINDFLG
jgi:hypothetical protein